MIKAKMEQLQKGKDTAFKYDPEKLSKEEMQQWVKDNQPKLLVMAGAGDIDVLVEPVKKILEAE